jgi:hypothetical protein
MAIAPIGSPQLSQPLRQGQQLPGHRRVGRHLLQPLAPPARTGRPETPGTLPFTGAHTPVLLLVGTGLLAAGIGLVLLVRRPARPKGSHQTEGDQQPHEVAEILAGGVERHRVVRVQR